MMTVSFKIYSVYGEKEPRPVVICQTKNDFDVPNELEAQIEHFKEENWDEADALSQLLEYGFTIEDFKYDESRYNWAKKSMDCCRTRQITLIPDKGKGK